MIVPIILCGLANHGTHTGAGCTADDGSLQSAAKQSSQHRPATRADQRAFARSNTTLMITVVVVMVAPVAVVVVVAAMAALPHSVVVGAVVVVTLRITGSSNPRNHSGHDKQRSQ